MINRSFLCDAWVDVPLVCFSAIILPSSLLRIILQQHSNLWVTQGIIKCRRKGRTIMSSLNSQYSLQTWIHLSLLKKTMLIYSVLSEILCGYISVFEIRTWHFRNYFFLLIFQSFQSSDLPCFLKKNKAERDNPILKNATCLHPVSKSKTGFSLQILHRAGKHGQTCFHYL